MTNQSDRELEGHSRASEGRGAVAEVIRNSLAAGWNRRRRQGVSAWLDEREFADAAGIGVSYWTFPRGIHRPQPKPHRVSWKPRSQLQNDPPGFQSCP